MSDAEIKARITLMRQQGKTREEIASSLGFSLSKLKRLIASFDVPARARKSSRQQPKRPREKAPVVNLEEGETLMEKAKSILGDRMGERYGCYTLDGRPINSWGLLKAAGLALG